MEKLYDFNYQAELWEVTLTLPFHKTHQFGDIKPFVLYPLGPEETYMCPVCALADWIHASKITSGTLFCQLAAGRPAERDSAVTSAQFLEMFRRNLTEIEVNFTPYGTHSFRRGGCQYLASWGGWSTEFSNMTIVKYLISWSDDPTESRDEFFNPKRIATVRCPHCGRSCCCL
ncbi:hypothetical protein BYT27DRAFT_7224030 [Phlegmacium glaucopus]|nr:hypothetical protein BYT27DRAFT_7224030 [Phlegmacium glaucopus]